MYLEKKVNVGYKIIKNNECLFEDGKQYNLYAWLADVRNNRGIKPISTPRGLPDDVSSELRRKPENWYDGDGTHSHTWLSVEQLLDVNYEETIEFKTKDDETKDIIVDEKITLRDFLGEEYFTSLQKVKEMGIDRLVFWFD
jgi:hypothetical protein